jgi:hypothetical protein
MENITIEIEHPQDPREAIQLTRYLYIVNDVKSSLLLALLEKRRDEALFWAYELYMSGLEEEAFNFVLSILCEKYSHYKRLTRFVNKKYQEWQTTSDATILGTCIVNMAIKTPYVAGFVKKYCTDEEVKSSIVEKRPPVVENNIFIIMYDISPYLTIHRDRKWQILREAIKYPVRTETRAIFEHDYHTCRYDEILQIYLCDWLQYASSTPIWANRIVECGGSAANLFETEDHEETFYTKYGLEPDEQPAEIAIKTLGRPDTKQLTWSEFYAKYC